MFHETLLGVVGPCLSVYFQFPVAQVSRLCSQTHLGHLRPGADAIKLFSSPFIHWKSCFLYHKSFTIVIYDHNDSGLYYKATIIAR
jgi:hypothetical protein